ncbi:NlpC/P60 family protein [Peribacillus sp. NPDC097295]|uniref:C40 family peptidase n=1 Tax=Peribacillus sp. NPDC097295 TaxID=3364402 RepID=UPI0037FDFC52
MSQIDDPNSQEMEGSSALKKAAGTGGKVVGKKLVKAAVKKGAAVAGSTLGWPVIVGVAAAVLLVMAGAIFFLFVILSSTGGEGNADFEEGFYGGEISEFGANEIPANYIAIYKAAEKKYGVPWNLLAAHHRVETVFSTVHMVSPVGAVGHMQFMPLTWIGWSYPVGNDVGNASIPKEILTDPSMIKKYGGYGVDANGDGKADPWNMEDAIFSAAHYLAKNGATEGRIREAVFAYNHADWYVEEIMGYADRYVEGYVEVGGRSSGGKTGTAVVDVGNKYIGRSQYVFGGGRNQTDIAMGRFDCSSFVHWAFKEVGVDLGPLGSTSTETLKNKGKPVSKGEMKPGDLVFFDTYKIDGHVGIYMGNGQFIGAQTNTGVAIADMKKGYWKEKFNGRVNRI